MHGQRRLGLPEFTLILSIGLMLIVPLTPFGEAWFVIDAVLGIFIFVAFFLLPLYAARRARARVRHLRSTTDGPVYLVELRVDDGAADVGALALDREGIRFDTGYDETVWDWSDVSDIYIERATPLPRDYLRIHLSSGQRLDIVAQTRLGVSRASALKQDHFFDTVRRSHGAPDEIRPHHPSP